MYTYKALIMEVTDGNTVIVDIYLGFGVWIQKQSIRLAKINAPELKGATIKAAQESKEFLKGLILNKWVMIRTEKPTFWWGWWCNKEKYGRCLGTILLEEDKNLIDINHKMVAEGYAVTYK